MKTLNKSLSLVLLIIIISTQNLFSQILISDNIGTANGSAMLEVASTTKGMLIPRMTTDQRNTLGNLATTEPGLLVFDTDSVSFFIYGKTAKGTNGWVNLSNGGTVWEKSGNNIYLSSSNYNVGIGTNTPNKKFVLKAQNDNDTLFEIQDKDGKSLMIITPTLTKFYFNESNKKGIAGGFAVGRYATAKTTSDTALFIVTPDSTRVYTSGLASTVEAGGFAVGRYATAKGNPIKFFNTNIHNTRIYTDGDAKKGIAGGFAVGRYATAKGENTHKYFFADIDSTRIYTDGSETKGIAGGFAVGRYTKAKGTSSNYMYMVPDNYFIGHQAGDSIQKSSHTGKYNLFCGYESGLSDTSGSYNSFYGYQTGYKNTDGSDNLFLGYQSGYNNTFGSENIFLGVNSGYSNTSGDNNIFLGDSSGFFNTIGNNNVFLGIDAGNKNTTGYQNVFVGRSAGHENTVGHRNIFIGSWTGFQNETGEYNVFMGNSAGNQNTSGFHNVFIGTASGHDNINGFQNTCIGFRSAAETDSSKLNVIIGAYAGSEKNLGDVNTIIGTYAASNGGTGEANTIIGIAAGNQNIGDENTMIGSHAGDNNITGSTNVFIGSGSGRYNNGNENTIVGPLAGYDSKGSSNVFLGLNAGRASQVSNRLYISNWAADSSQALIYGEFDNKVLGLNAYVGIGTSVPATNTKLHVRQSGTPLSTQNAGTVACFQSNLNTWYWSRISVIAGNTGSSVIDFGDADLQNISYIRYDHSNDGMYFQTNGSEQMIINSSGNIGVGTNNPSSKLEIYGATQNIKISNTAETESGLIFNDTGDASSQYAKILYNSGNNKLNFYNANATAKLTVNTTGVNIGEGTTFKKIQAGSFNVGTNTGGGIKTVTINFPSAFANNPNVNVTVKGQDYSDVFAVTTRNVGTNSFQVNIYRVDSSGGVWGQTLYLDWYAWE